MTPIIGDAVYVAAKIKEHFFAAKKEQLGKAYRPSSRFVRPEIWQAAAEICIELKADPYSFVRCALTHSHVPGGPYPNQLCGNAIRTWFADYQAVYGVSENGDIFANEIKSLIS